VVNLKTLPPKEKKSLLVLMPHMHGSRFYSIPLSDFDPTNNMMQGCNISPSAGQGLCRYHAVKGVIQSSGAHELKELLNVKKGGDVLNFFQKLFYSKRQSNILKQEYVRLCRGGAGDNYE